MRESVILRRIMLALGRGMTRVFRNNCGVAWQGDARKLSDGSVLIRNPRRVVYGLAPGSSDLIGWRQVIVTPQMVGQRLAQFVALEVKTGKGRAQQHQRNFVEQVQQAGGIAAVVRDEAQAQAAVN